MAQSKYVRIIDISFNTFQPIAVFLLTNSLFIMFQTLESSFC